MTAGDSVFSPPQMAALTWAMGIASVLSFGGSLFACGCYIAFRHKRTFGLQLVFLLSLNDAASQVWIALQIARSFAKDSDLGHTLCIAQGYVLSYFLLSCTLWSTAIAYTLFATILRDQQLHEVAQQLPYITLLCQGLPLVSCIVNQVFDAYGPSIAWCWIGSTSTTNRILQFATHYGPIWLCIAFSVYVYISVRLQLRALLKSSHWAHTTASASQAPPSLSSLGRTSSQWISQTDFETDNNIFGSATSEGEAEEGSYFELSEIPLPPSEAVSHSDGLGPGGSTSSHRPCNANQLEQYHRLGKLYRRLMVYPLILVLCWSWGTVNRLYGVFFPRQNMFWLTLVHITFICIQGLLNSVAYGLTEGIGSEISTCLIHRRRRQQW